MRKIIVNTIPPTVYKTPDQAIAGSVRMDDCLRTVMDDQVQGKVVLQLLWNDSTLVLKLDDGQSLAIVAQDGHVGCSLGDVSSFSSPSNIENDLLIVLDNCSFEWRRNELRDRCVGQAIKKLWFGPESFYIYLPEILISCHALETSPEKKPFLFWEESD